MTNLESSQLYHAIDYMHDYMFNYGRIGVHSKEKYGTARLYVTFWDGRLHSLTHPGYVYCQYPDWLWKLDCLYISKLIQFLRLPGLLCKYQSFVYRKAYSNVLNKYPNLRSRILPSADHQELLKGL